MSLKLRKARQGRSQVRAEDAASVAARGLKRIRKRRYRTENQRWAHLLLNSFENRCTYCGTSKGLVLHHKIPLSKGGPHQLGNIEAVCRKCHKKVHAQLRRIFPLKSLKKGAIDVVMEDWVEANS